MINGWFYGNVNTVMITPITTALHSDHAQIWTCNRVNHPTKKDQNETNKLKFDTVAYNLVNDRVLKARIQSAKMCGVKEIAPKKVEYMQYYVPLSAYDETNYKTYTEGLINQIGTVNKESNDKINDLKNLSSIDSYFIITNVETLRNTEASTLISKH